MSLVVVNAARLDVLTELVATRLNGAQLCLFGAPHSPAAGDTLATYLAIESTFPGYGRQTLNSWSFPAIDAMGNAQTDEVQRTFTATGSSMAQVWGYFVIAVGGGLYCAEADPSAPWSMGAAGRVYNVTCHFFGGPLVGPPF